MGPASSPVSFVLASASPRREALLSQLGLRFTIDAPDIDETPRNAESAEAYVERVARTKASTVAARQQLPVLAADTAVVVDGEVLGKPDNEQHAHAMLKRLSGREHRVLTAVAIDGAVKSAALVETVVSFRALSPAEISWYVSTGEGKDKAGGYASQARAGAFIASMRGSPTNVIGLPLAETLALLQTAGIGMPW